MPHCELHYSSDLEVDPKAILAEVEAIVLAHDAGAGATKGRAYPAPVFHHTHFKASIALLAKPHRDAGFLAALHRDLETALSAHLPRPCWLSIDLTLSGPGYLTKELT